MAEAILVTGGAGFIGSHTVVELIKAGYDVTVLDNLSNSREESINRIERIAGRRPDFRKGDVRDADLLKAIFSTKRFSAVIHFAGLKAVGESVEQPLSYYDNNVGGTLVLCNAMRAQGLRTLVFSSSATVYGNPESVPIREDAKPSPTNPYGRSKMMVEEVLRDLERSEAGWNIALLRYFNPVGAHESGLIGEDPRGVPNNLMPFLCQVATGRLQQLRVFGNDYPTPDGTGVRDYIHVVDLALGHLCALNALKREGGVMLANLGTGCGYSVLEMVSAFERASSKKIPHTIVDRRPGDIAQCYADSSFAKDRMGWSANRTLADMCRDAWHWQSLNPEGFGGK